MIQNPVAKAAGFFCTKSGHWTYISVKEIQSFAVVKEVRTIRAGQIQSLFAGNIRKLLEECVIDYEKLMKSDFGQADRYFCVMETEKNFSEPEMECLIG